MSNNAGNAIQFSGTGAEAKDVVRIYKERFEDLSKTNDQPYTLTFGLAFTNVKQGLNESTVKAYLETIKDAITKFANSEDLSITLGIESPSKEFIALNQQVGEIVKKAQGIQQFGGSLAKSTQEAFQTSQKLKEPVQEIAKAAEKAAKKAGLKVAPTIAKSSSESA